MLYERHFDGPVDLSGLCEEELDVVSSLERATFSCVSHSEFQSRNMENVIALSKKSAGDGWYEHPVFLVYADIAGRIGIRDAYHSAKREIPQQSKLVS